MADISLPNFAAALPEPRVYLPDDARNNTGLALASGALNSITNIANTYTKAKRTQEQANIIGDTMMQSNDPAVQESGRMYKSLAKQMPVNYFAMAGANGRDPSGTAQSGMLDDAIKIIRDNQLQAQRKELLNLEQQSRESLLGLGHQNKLAEIAASGEKSINVIGEQTKLQEEYAKRRFEEQADIKMGDYKIRQAIIKQESSNEISRDEMLAKQDAYDQFVEARSKKQIRPDILPVLTEAFQDPEKTAGELKVLVGTATTETAQGAQRTSSSTSSAKDDDEDSYMKATIKKIQ